MAKELTEYITGFTDMDFAVFSEDARTDEAVEFKELVNAAVLQASDFRVGIRYERKSEILISPVTHRSHYMTDYDDLVVFFSIPQSLPVAKSIQAKAVEVQDLVDAQVKEKRRQELLAQKAKIEAELENL